MIFSTINKTPSFVIEKLVTLFQLLKETKCEYEVFAEKMSNIQIKHTILSLAQETNQYAIELWSHINCIGHFNYKINFENNSNEIKTTIIDEVNILNSCEISEHKMINAYRKILKEHLLNDSITKLIHEQLNGFLHTLLKIRLLNMTLHR